MIAQSSVQAATDIENTSNEAASAIDTLSSAAALAATERPQILHKRPQSRPSHMIKKHPRQKNRRGKAFTPMQYSALIKCLTAESYPNREQLTRIASYVNLAPDRVKVWFQNARVRGISAEMALMDVPATASEILSGTAPPNEDMLCTEAPPPPGQAPVPTRDSSTQCAIMPPTLIRLWESGALNSILRSTTASVITSADYCSMAPGNGRIH